MIPIASGIADVRSVNVDSSLRDQTHGEAYLLGATQTQKCAISLTVLRFGTCNKDRAESVRALVQRRMLWRCLSVAVLSVSVALARPVCAQEEIAQQSAETAARARGAFEAGLEHFSQRRFRDAIHAFLVAAQLVPSADLWFNVARAFEELGEWDSAVTYYQNYLRDRVEPPDQAQVEARIEVLESRAADERAARARAPTEGTLTISSNTDGTDLELDGSSLGQTPFDDMLVLDPGLHPLNAERDGYVPWRSALTIEPGLRTGALVALQPSTTYRPVFSDRIFTWISFGLSALALGTSIGLGVEADSRSDRSEAREWSNWSDVALGGALGFGALGFTLFFAEGRAIDSETTTIEPEISSSVRDDSDI